MNERIRTRTKGAKINTSCHLWAFIKWLLFSSMSVKIENGLSRARFCTQSLRFRCLWCVCALPEKNVFWFIWSVLLCLHSLYPAMMNNGRAIWPWNFYHFHHYFSSILFNSHRASAAAAASVKSYIENRLSSQVRTLAISGNLCVLMNANEGKSNHLKYSKWT